jgi:UTP--glucose-1-phosphate uridylyltransferase
VKEYAFLSNIDNLCATVDFDMLYHIYCNETEICVEATTPNRTDTDGGYLTVSPTDGKVRLVEISEVSADRRDDFKRRHKFFNTNNIWVNLRALKKMMDTTDIRDRIIVTVRLD